MMTIQNVVVTGGLGFVGARIIEHIHDKYPQCHVTCLDNRSPRPGDEKPYIRYVKADVTCAESVRVALRDIRPQGVVHSAAVLPPLPERYRRRMQTLVTKVNVEGTRNVLKAAKEAGVEAFVYTSSSSAVADDFAQQYVNMDERWPTVEIGKASIYGESKAQAEALVLQANSISGDSPKATFKTCALRPAVTFGEGDYQFVPSIVSLITDKNESPYRIGDGFNMWDTVYVGNVADAHVLALENLLSDKPIAAGEAFFIQNNEPVGSREFMLFIWREFNGHIPPFEIGIPENLAWVVGMMAEMYSWLTGKPTTLSRGSVIEATMSRYASGEKARIMLGYEPKVGLEEGLRRSCKEYAARLKSK